MARTALAKGKRDDAVTKLLEAWRNTRAPVVADALDAIAPLAVEPNQLARAHRVDPRLASFVHGQLLGMAHPASSSREIWAGYFAILARVQDPRTADVVARARSAWANKLARQRAYWKFFGGALDAAEAAARAIPVTAVPRAEVAFALAKPKPAAHDPIAALFAAVYQDPDDDHARSVLADALLEREDPRGELIRLQLQPKLSPAQQRRVTALVEAHGKRWLGALAPFASPKWLVFERGFPKAVSVVRPSKRSPAFPVGAPEAATIEELVVSGSFTIRGDRNRAGGLRDGVAAWIRSFPNLRRLELWGSVELLAEIVADGPVPFEYLNLASATSPGLARAAFFTRANFPKLAEVANYYGTKLKLPW